MTTRLDVQLSKGKSDARQRRSEIDPLRLLVIADLRAAARGAEESLSAARLFRVDTDNFDAFVGKLSPQLLLEFPGVAQGLPLSFKTFEDFHPDFLFDRVPSVAELWRSRERLRDPNTFQDEKARLLRDQAPVADHSVQSGTNEAGHSTLERLLGKPATQSTGAAVVEHSGFDAVLRAIVAPYVTPARGPEHDRLLASVELALSGELRRVLHTPSFQRLEAAYRGLHWLVRDNPVGEDLEIWVLDASRAQLDADLRACAGELDRSQLYRLIVDQRPGATPFSVIVGDFSFVGSEADVPLLAGLGALAAQAGGVFLAGAEPALVGASDLPRQAHRGDWSALEPAVAERMALLRGSPVARFIGLALPRVLGRSPYGKRSDPISRFDFSELASSDPSHEDFLWLNPAFGCAQLIIRAFAQAGWSLRLDGPLELSDLPLATYGAVGSQEMKPCTEVLLDDASAERMLDYGVMPWISHRNLNSARLLRLTSIAQSGDGLRGPWG